MIIDHLKAFKQGKFIEDDTLYILNVKDNTLSVTVNNETFMFQYKSIFKQTFNTAGFYEIVLEYANKVNEQI